MATKINNLTYDVPLDIRHWRHPAEIAIIPEVENGTTYGTELFTDGSKTGDNVGAKYYICEWRVGTATEVVTAVGTATEVVTAVGTATEVVRGK
jgi:hypothetical protein